MVLKVVLMFTSSGQQQPTVLNRSMKHDSICHQKKKALNEIS